MKYVAKCYVRVAGKVFTPGEIVDRSIPEDKLPRLLKLNAIAPMTFIAVQPPVTGETPAGDREDAPMGTDSPEDSGSGAEDASEEDFEDAEAPEIDVAAGIVTPDEAAPSDAEKPKARRKKREG